MKKSIVIIMSHYDTFTIARLINQSIPIRYVMKTDNLVTFSTEDYTDDIQDVMIKNQSSCVSCFIDKRRKMYRHDLKTKLS